MKKYILLGFMFVISLFVFSQGVYAYEIPPALIKRDNWVPMSYETVTINSIDYTAYTIENMPLNTSKGVVTFYNFNSAYNPSQVYLENKDKIHYISVTGGTNAPFAINPSIMGNQIFFWSNNTYVPTVTVYLQGIHGAADVITTDFVYQYIAQFEGSIFDFLNYSDYSGYQNGYDIGKTAGYDIGKNDGYDIGYDFGYDAGLDIGYDIGYHSGLDIDFDWFTWASTFFLMPFRIMNIQVLPGVRIGYFALFSLLLGVVGWFFFIVGKGGGRKK